jgi:Arc/MetJ-type ribon-helix-helix transcriptional regulator
MTIHLPKELESSIEAVVHGGHFTSVDEAMAEAARLLLRTYERPIPPAAQPDVEASELGSIGAMSEDAELLDEIVADAYRRRREDKPRDFDL